MVNFTFHPMNPKGVRLGTGQPFFRLVIATNDGEYLEDHPRTRKWLREPW